MNDRQTVTEANGQREMRKRWDNKLANRDLIKEWAESTEESRKGWGEKEWDVMRKRMEEEKQKTGRASLSVGSDVKELESILMRSLMETGTSAGNTLKTTGTSGYSTSRRSTAQGHSEAPFSRITFMPHSGLDGSYLNEFPPPVFQSFQPAALVRHHFSLSDREADTGLRH